MHSIWYIYKVAEKGTSSSYSSMSTSKSSSSIMMVFSLPTSSMSELVIGEIGLDELAHQVQKVVLSTALPLRIVGLSCNNGSLNLKSRQWLNLCAVLE